MLFFDTPQPLPKITAPTAADLTKKYQPQPAALSLVKPDQTPAEYIAELEKKKMSTDAVHALAHGLPERDSVWWACQSSRKVAGKLSPSDMNALNAAEAWVKNPSPATQAASATAAAATDHRGPGAWSAQAAAWSQSPAPAMQTPAAQAPAMQAPKVQAPAVQAPAVNTPALTGSAVAGAVLLAAGLVKGPPMPSVPQPKLQAPDLTLPKVQTPPAPPPPPVPVDAPPPPAFAKSLQPFIDLGKDVASGKNSWA